MLQDKTNLTTDVSVGRSWNCQARGNYASLAGTGTGMTQYFVAIALIVKWPGMATGDILLTKFRSDHDITIGKLPYIIILSGEKMKTL